MTIQEFEAKQAAMSDDELAQKVRNQVSQLCNTGGKSFRMCVPPSVDDTDMLLCEMLRRFKLLSELSKTETNERI